MEALSPLLQSASALIHGYFQPLCNSLDRKIKIMIDEAENNPRGSSIGTSLQIIVLLQLGMMRQAEGSHQGNPAGACRPAILLPSEPLIPSGDLKGAFRMETVALSHPEMLTGSGQATITRETGECS